VADFRARLDTLSPAARGHLAMLAFSMLVAGSFSMGGMVANDIAPVALNAVRFLMAALLVGLIGLASGTVRRGDRRAPWRYLILGALFATYFVTMFEGLKTAPPVSTAAMFTLTPVMSAGFGWLLLRQVTSRFMGVALAIGAAGAIWVIFRADMDALLAFQIGRGEAIFFWGVVAHAIYPVAVRGLNRGEHPIGMTFGMLVAGTLVLFLYGAGDLAATDWGGLPVMVWVVIGYTSVFAGAATFTLLPYAAMRLPSAKVMAYTYLVPSWVILWELALGNGAPRALVLAGVVLTIVSLVMLLKER